MNFLSLYVKAGITLATICKNLPLRKYGRFCSILDTGYVFNHHHTLNKLNYSLDMELIMSDLLNFLVRCIPILLFDLNSGIVDASIGPLDYIAGIYNFKSKWLEKQKQLKSVEHPNKYRDISTKKFCCKLRNYLNLEDFIE